MEIVLATRNKKKVEEIQRIIGDMDVKFLTLNDFASCPEIEEDSDTFEGNASKKAVEIMKCTGKPAVADDSGLEVFALGNVPGVRSARYAGDSAKDIDNVKKLLHDMKGLPDGGRGARFVCCITLALPDGRVESFWGFSEGSIGTEPHGEMGFGYDPVFYPSGHTRTFAEMAPAEKDTLSHRKAALEKLRMYLKNLIF